MAQIADTYDSYAQIGIKEDLSDVIYDISPSETPFFSACKKMTASNTFAEWQTDSLRSSGANAQIEGGEATIVARTPTTRLGNYTQIFADALIISDTDEGLSKAGRAKEMAYQTLKTAKEIKLDIELALLANNARVAGSSSVARELAGVPAWLTTNTEVGATGVDPTGDGTNARTDGTQEAFTQTRFDTIMQSIWEAGGTPDTVLLSAFQMNKALLFTGNNNQRSTVGVGVGGKNTVSNTTDIYITAWGSVQFQMSRECRSRDVFIFQMDKWGVKTLRPMKNTPLAKTGDASKRQVITELTLCSLNEAASGAIYDNTTA